MKLQAARIAKLDEVTSRVAYRDDLPPILIIEDGEDLEARIAEHRAECESQGYDPELPPLVIILAEAEDEETRDLYRERGAKMAPIGRRPVIIDDIPLPSGNGGDPDED